jgi:glutathione S-transferase
MRVLTTLTSPYGRIVRALIIEKGFQDRVEIFPTVTRTPDAPVLDVNPSGRVPTLITEDGTMFEDSPLICAYLDSLEDPQVLAPQTDWNARILEARVRSMLDGIAVWSREIRRPENEQAPSIVAHETKRAHRLAGIFDQLVADGAFDGPLDMAQLILGCTLHRTNIAPKGFDWRPANPNLAAWVDKFGKRPSMQETLPPG